MNGARSWLEAVAAGAAVGLILPLLGQLLPPFHVPTHELTTALALASAAMAYGCGAWWAGRLRTSPPGAQGLEVLRGAMARVTVALLTMGPVAWTTLVVADRLGCGCRLHLGAAYFWFTWPPLALLAGVVGVALGASGWRRRSMLLLIAGVLLVDLLHDGMQALVGFRIVDLLVGKPLAFDQRSPMSPVPDVHVYQRLYVLALAGVAWCWVAWRAVARRAVQDRSIRAEARRRALPALLGAAALAVVATTHGSHLGLGWGSDALHTLLSQRLEGDGVVVLYPPGGRASVEAPVVLREVEWSVERYRREWGIDPQRPIVVHLFDDRDQIRELTDTASTHVVFRRVYGPWWMSVGGTVQHELAHALHLELRPSPAVALSRGILEGLAMAYEHGFASLPEAHSGLAGALAADELPRARELMHPLGFFQVHEGHAYQASGSFVGWLILEHGFERFVALQRSHTLDFEAVYGRDIDQLDADWRAFLATVPVDLDEQVEARDRFDADLWPAYGARCCPKLGRVVPTPVELAEQLWKAEAWADALEAYRGLWVEEGKPRQAFQAAQCEWRMGRAEQGLALIEEALAAPDLAEAERYRLIQGKLALLLATEGWDDLEATLAARDALDDEPSPDRLAVSALLLDPILREPAAEALLAQDPGRRRLLFEDLTRAHPEHPELGYLYTTRVFEQIGLRYGLGVRPDERQRAMDALALAERSPGAVDTLAEELLAFIDKAIRGRDLDLAEQTLEQALPLADKPTTRWQLELRRERIAWERGRGSG